MGFTHNSNTIKGEPNWGSVDKTALPNVAFADRGEPGKKSTRSYPHHAVQNAGNKDKNGIWTTGTLYLHQGGLKAAWAAANGARSGQTASPGVIAHLRSHRRALGLEKLGASANRKMTPMVNFKKNLSKELDITELEHSLDIMLAAQELEIELAGKKKKRPVMPMPMEPDEDDMGKGVSPAYTDPQNRKELPKVKRKKPVAPASNMVENSGGNLSQDQLQSLQDPNSPIVELGDLDFAETPEYPEIAIPSPEKDNSPQKPVQMNPGEPGPDTHPDRYNREAMDKYGKKTLPLVGVLDIRALWKAQAETA